jgi:hypothetical protein
MKDTDETHPGGPKETGVPGEFSDGVRGRGEKSVIGDALVAPHNSSKRLGHCKGQEEIAAGKELPELPGQPVVCFMVLAGRTVPIPAGGGDKMHAPAGLAPVESGSEITGAALENGTHDLLVG